MNKLKYYLFATSALLATYAQADFQLNDTLYYNIAGTYITEDGEEYNPAIQQPISFLYSEDSDDISFTKNYDPRTPTDTTIFAPSAIIATENDTKLRFTENSVITMPDDIDWENNNATLKFEKGVKLKLDQSGSKIKTYNNIDGKLGLIVANGSDNVDLVIKAKNSDADLIDDHNDLYTITHGIKQADNTTTYTASQKSVAEIAGSTYNENQAKALKQMMQSKGNSLYDTITELVQLGESDAAIAELNQLPGANDAYDQALIASAKEQATLAISRMSGIAGGEEAEASINFTPWVQGMFNHTHNTQSEGFSANTKGISMGIDAQIDNAWMAGIGYSNVNTRVKTDLTSTRGYGNNVFVYGQYKPADWYVRGMAGYGRTEYKAKNNGTKWNVDSYTANAYAGYIWGILDTSIGARYTYLNNDSYKVKSAKVSVDDTDNLTAVADFKVSKEFAQDSFILEPSAHVGFTYDVVSADSTSNINLGGGYGSYQVKGERLHKAGVEAGTGVVFKKDNMELHLNYEGAFRKDNYSNGGLVKFKYNF